MLFRKCRSARLSLRPAGFIAAAFILCTIARSGVTENAGRFQSDVDFLNGKIASYRESLKLTPENQQRLASLDAAITKLKTNIGQLSTLADSLDSKETRLRTLKENDLEPKAREVERTRQYAEQRFSDANRERQYFMQEVQAHNAKSNLFTLPNQAAELTAYNQEKIDLNTKGTLIWSSTESAINEARQMVEMAMQSFTFAQQEFRTTEQERSQLATNLKETSDTYFQNRDTLVRQLIAVEKDFPQPGNHNKAGDEKAENIEATFMLHKPLPIGTSVEEQPSMPGPPATNVPIQPVPNTRTPQENPAPQALDKTPTTD